MKVKDILAKKGPHVFTIGENNSVAEGLKILANNNIGALIVLNADGKVVGIISERDYIKLLNKDATLINELLIKDAMTKNVIIVEPEDELSYIESIMTSNRIRHLPVIQNDILVGIVSIGDAVKVQIENLKVENKYLFDYIGGNVK